MKTWNEIIRESKTPEQRLYDLLDVWKEIMAVYTPPVLIFDPVSFKAIMNESFDRNIYPSQSTSILRTPESAMNDKKDFTTRIMMQDCYNYSLLKALADIFNQSLNQDQREIIVRHLFNGEACASICRQCGLSESSFYRMLRKAKRILIMNYCLDYYNEYGIEKHNWFAISNDRRKWNKGQFFAQDIMDWPEYNQK